MPTVEFYHSAESPPCRAVEMVAAIVGVTLNKHHVNVMAGEQLKEDYLKLNPRRKVPLIIDGDLHLGESRAIMAYLVNKHLSANNTLYPTEPKMRARIDELLYFDAGTLAPAIAKLLYPKMFGPVKSLDPEAEKNLRSNLDYMDKTLEKNKGKKFYLGDHLTLADIAFAATLSLMYCLCYDIGEYQHLVAYWDRLKVSITKYGEINSEPDSRFRKMIEMRQAS